MTTFVCISAASHAADHLEELKNDLSLSYSRIRNILGIDSYETGINILFVDSAGEMKQFTGNYVHSGMSFSGHDMLAIVYNKDKRAHIKHEGFHLMAYTAWGATSSRLLNEGGAVYADNRPLA